MSTQQALREPPQTATQSADTSSDAGSLPLLNLASGRKAALEYFENTWALTERLFPVWPATKPTTLTLSQDTPSAGFLLRPSGVLLRKQNAGERPNR